MPGLLSVQRKVLLSARRLLDQSRHDSAGKLGVVAIPDPETMPRAK